MEKRLSELPKVARIAIVGAIGFGILCCLLIVFTSLANATSSSPVTAAIPELPPNDTTDDTYRFVYDYTPSAGSSCFYVG